MKRRAPEGPGLSSLANLTLGFSLLGRHGALGGAVRGFLGAQIPELDGAVREVALGQALRCRRRLLRRHRRHPGRSRCGRRAADAWRRGRAGGSAMPAGFLRTFVASEPLVSPEVFDVCPVLLVHPADDRWTDVSLSRPFFDRLKVPKGLVMLGNAGLPVRRDNDPLTAACQS